MVFSIRKISVLATGIVMAIGLSACAPSVGPEPELDVLGARAVTGFIPLSGPTLFNKLAGKTIAGGVNHRPGSWAIYNREDGYGVFKAGSSYLDVQWAIQGNRYCIGDPDSSDKLCFDVFHKNGSYQLVDEEGVDSFYTTAVAEGDVYRLVDFVGDRSDSN